MSRTCSFSISASFLASSTCVLRSRSNPNDNSLSTGMEAELPVEKAAQEPIGLYLLDTIPQRHSGKARSSFFFVLIRLLRKPLTPDLLSRLQALSPDLLLRGALASSDPCDSELCLLTAVLNYNLISDLHLASIATQLHTMVADIESMREMAILTPGDPESYWHDRFGSLRPPFACAKSRHVPRSLRVPAPDTDVFHAVHFRFSPNYCCALEILFLAAGRCLRRRWIIPPARVLQNFIDCQKKRKGAVTLVQQYIGEPHGLRCLVRTPAQDHNWQGWLFLPQHLSDLIAVHTGHIEVQSYRVNGVFSSELNSSCAIGSGQNLVPFGLHESRIKF